MIPIRIVPGRHIEIFAGAGGMALGCRMAGFASTELHDIDPTACATLRWNTLSRSPTLIGAVCEQDVRETVWSQHAGKVGLLAGGAPCQPFSLGGVHEGHRDSRNLFPEIVRAVADVRPAAVLVENVRGILREDFAPYLTYVLRQLADPSIVRKKRESWRTHSKRLKQHQDAKGYTPEYHVSCDCLNAADFGVPQLRHRAFIVATDAKNLPRITLPIATHSRQALLVAQARREYWERRSLHPPRLTRPLLRFPDDDTRHPWVTVRDVISDLPEAAAEECSAWSNHWSIAGARSYPGHSGSRLDGPAKTIKAGVHGVAGGENTVVLDSGRIRYLTLREAARLQTFPDDHFFVGARSGVVRQIGNAVPCKLAEAVARPIAQALLRREALRQRKRHLTPTHP